ncbi:hypothetical protein ACFQ14_00140 [Pseudahrensia aquimaris]|uniref:Uncharacterized protein n=1 Tax=Pseudahrensia aquimaris TaxID=744461 RepID=A0ABW3FBH4_9HYPH
MTARSAWPQHEQIVTEVIDLGAKVECIESTLLANHPAQRR